MTTHLLNWEMSVEYIAANLESGALRAMAIGLTPTAFNSAAWHLRGLQTDDELIRAGWNPGGATWILDHIPTALNVNGLKSTWTTASEPQYVNYK